MALNVALTPEQEAALVKFHDGDDVTAQEALQNVVDVYVLNRTQQALERDVRTVLQDVKVPLTVKQLGDISAIVAESK